MIRFEIAGREVAPNSIADAISAALLEAVRTDIASKIQSVRDPETGEFPTVVVYGDDLENLSIRIEGSDALIELVRNRLRLEEEEGSVSDPHVEVPQAFLCYASENAELAQNIAASLQANGIQVWIDQWCISTGESFRQKIDEGIAGCTHFLVLLTPESIGKPWVNMEIDAGLVRKLQGQCRFLPVRSNLQIDELPPLLSVLHSPEVDTDDSLQQLINEIHGVTRRPPLGPRPVPVQDPPAETIYSPAAMSVAKLFVERSVEGMFLDPQLSIEEAMDELRLTREDTDDALHELSAFMDDDGWGNIAVKNNFFPEFDRFWKPWVPRDDATRIAVDSTSDPKFTTSIREIAQRYGWEPRRMNPAINWLLERGLIDEDKAIGSMPFTMHRLLRNDNLRRFAKGRR